MRLRGGILLIAFLIGLSQMVSAQAGDWAVMKQLLPGQKVKVELANGKPLAGTVRSVSDDGIEFKGKHVVQKQDVQQVLLRIPGHHGRNALIGLGIGGGFGMAAGAACNGEGLPPGRAGCMGIGAVFFGGVGAGIGALLPSHGTWRLVYRAQ